MPLSAPSGTQSFAFCEELCDWKFSSRLLQGAPVVLRRGWSGDDAGCEGVGSDVGELGCLICKKMVPPHGRTCAGVMG